jgi:hypothetical protein
VLATLLQAEMALVKLGDQVSGQEATLAQLQQVLDDTMKVRWVCSCLQLGISTQYMLAGNTGVLC